MAEEDDCDATSSVGEINTVFIDTSLDTHLGMPVSDSHTVLQLKKNIINQHPKSFPELGKIKINALKVKRKGLFYHLSDSMLVKSAFKGAKKCWFLSVDVTTVMQPIKVQMPNLPMASDQLALIPFTKNTSGDSSNHLGNNSSNKIFNNCDPGNSCNEVQKDLEMEVKNVTPDDCSRVCSDFNGGLDYTSKIQEQLSGRHVISETNSEHKGGDFQVGVNDNHCNNPLEGSIRNEPGVSKKRKSKKDGKAELSNFTAKNDDVDIYEHSSGKACPLIPQDTKMETVNDPNIVSETNANHKDADSQVGVNDNHCNNPLEGSIRNEPGVSKRCKSKKKDKAEVSNFTAQNDDMAICEPYSGKTCPLIPQDTKMEAVKDPNIVSEANANHKDADSQVGVNDHHCNNPLEGSIRNEPGVNQKRKSKKKDKADVSTFTAENDDVDINEHSLGKTCPLIPKDTKMEIVNDPEIVSKANANHKDADSQVGVDAKDDDIDDKQSSDKTVRKVPVDVEMVNIEAVGEADLGFLKTTIQTRAAEAKNLVSDVSSGDALNSIPASRKRKRIKSKEADNPQAEDNYGISAANQKNTTAFVDNFITETPKVVDLLADTNTQKSRKKKKRVSINQEVFVAPPSSQSAREERCKEDVESVANDIDKAFDSAFVSESNVQLAIPSFAVGGDIVGHDVANAKGNNDVHGVGHERGSKATKKSKKRHSSNLNEPPPQPVTELSSMMEDVVLPGGEDFVRENDGINVPDKVKEQRESPYNCGIEEMNLEKCGQTVLGEKAGEPKIAVDSANLTETNINLEAGKSAGSRKLKKKAKKPVSETFVVLSVDNGHNSANENDGAMKMCSPLSQTKIPKPTSLDTSLVDADDEGGNNGLSKSVEENLVSEEFVQKNYGKEAGAGSRVQKKETKLDFTQGKTMQKSTGVSAAKPRKKMRSERESHENEVIVQKINVKETETDSQIKEKENKMDFAQQNVTDITPKDTGVSAAKSRKKMKKNQTSTAETHSASPIKKQKLGAEELISSNDGNREDENAFKKEKLGKSSSKNQSTGKKLEPKINIADGHGSPTSTADLSQAPSSDTHKGNSIETPIDPVDGDVLNSPNMSDTNQQVDLSKRKEDGINFKEYFSRPIVDRETPPVNVVQKLQSSDMAVKSKNSTQVSLENGNERKTHPKKSTDFKHKVAADRSTLRGKKELEQKLSLGNNRSTVAKSSGKRMGEVVNSSRRETSLLATPASIFQDQSSESSEDSDTSTKAPSDDSSSSSDSEEEGADSARRADFERSKHEPKTPYSQRIDMDMILKRSSRYKQAKLSAIPSQLEDTESQPVDFVPDSQPNQ